MTRNDKCRVVLIGLDGATFDLLLPWAQAGQLPSIGKILQAGCHGPLQSAVPPNTAPAWSSIATGKNPAKHSVFEFFRMNQGGYLSPVNGNSLTAQPLWEILSRAGRRVISLNFPMSYPPRPVNGLLVTGLLTPPNAENFCYPPELKEQIASIVEDYQIMPRKTYVRGRVDEWLQELHDLLDKKIRLAHYLMDHYEWDLFMQVFSETDIIQHGLWQCLDPQHPHHDLEEAARYGDAILHLYQKLDAFIGEVREKLGPEVPVIIISDHGMGPLYQYIHINNWLMREGFLRVKRNPWSLTKYAMFRLGVTPMNAYAVMNRLGSGGIKNTLRSGERGYSLARKVFFDLTDIDWSQTKAYSIGGGNAGLIFVNLKGREPFGAVEPGDEYEQVREELIERLRHFRHPLAGEPMAQAIYRKEEIYEGDHLFHGPDIVYIQKDPCYVNYSNFAFSSSHIFGDAPSYVSAQHREYGILLMAGEAFRSGVQLQGARITDIAPTILYLLDLPVSIYMDGKVLTNALMDELVSAHPIRWTDDRYQRDSGDVGFTEEQEEVILERLKGLGYL